MSIRPAEPGLVINYSYLWWDEHAAGRDEGRKDRPCIVVAVRELAPQLRVVTVVPVTHRPPAAGDGVELPAQLKRYLGLDEFILLTETNDFVGQVRAFAPFPTAGVASFTSAYCPRATLRTYGTAWSNDTSHIVYGMSTGMLDGALP